MIALVYVGSVSAGSSCYGFQMQDQELEIAVTNLLHGFMSLMVASPVALSYIILRRTVQSCSAFIISRQNSA